MADDEVPVLKFDDGLPGFPDARRFALVRLDDEGLVYDLQSLDSEQPRFVVVPPTVFFPDYAPEIDGESAARLGLEDADDAAVLLVVTVGSTVAESSANLMAPIVVNLRTNRAGQVLLSDPDLPVRAPLAAPAA